MNIHIVLPAYNEAQSIKQVIENSYKEFQEAGYKNIEFIVVNDGSLDQTKNIVRSLTKTFPIKLLNHPKNLGLGKALQTGLYYTIENSLPDDIIITTETDGTQETKKLVDLTRLITNGADLTVATPLTNNGFKNVAFHRQFFSRAGNFLYTILFPIEGLHDYTNLVRGYKAPLLKKGLDFWGQDKFINLAGFESVPDIILKLRRFNPVVKEIDIEIDHENLKRSSSINIFKTIFLSLKLCFKHLLNSN